MSALTRAIRRATARGYMVTFQDVADGDLMVKVANGDQYVVREVSRPEELEEGDKHLADVVTDLLSVAVI